MPAGGAAGSRKPGVRLSGNGVAFACSCPCGVETGVAFAGEKWVFFVRFSVAEVSPVSTVAVHGRAVVMAVSRWPASVVAEASSVSAVVVEGRAVVMAVSRWPASAAAEASLFQCRHVAVFHARKSSPCGAVVIVKVRKSSPPPGVDPKIRTATHSHTQRIQKRPGPWPRALPATHELR